MLKMTRYPVVRIYTFMLENEVTLFLKCLQKKRKREKKSKRNEE